MTADVENYLPFTIADTVLPVIDEVAKNQAEAKFAGYYSSKDTNTSLTLTTDGSQTGLEVSQLISNGIVLNDLFESVFPNLVWRLQPNQLDHGARKVGFTSYQISAETVSDTGNPSVACQGWMDIDQMTYG